MIKYDLITLGKYDISSFQSESYICYLIHTFDFLFDYDRVEDN